jgi:hypothetical protein
VTEECIVRVLGYLPEGPEDMTEEQKIALGQDCFGQNHQSQGPPLQNGGMDEATKQCIIDILGFMPEHPEDLSYDDKACVGAACFGMNLSNADDLGHSAVECIQGLLGYLPDSPDAMTDAEKNLVN